MTIANSDIERIVLMNACEDYAPLWQILGEVLALGPQGGEKSALQATRQAVAGMLQRGLLEVYRRESRTSDFVRIEPSQREAALKSDAYWAADATDTVEISLAATTDGERAYKSSAKSKPA
jgi:hypothetical protein